ncbi:ABC transporter ATP-binding protein [Testudinibacter sp. TR-2022]|uniref:ABC transporter ATP-binding protein n=1 Tax=Testudinibacter sp. TR-2022 TaxID=2585029 RepID=UPI0011185724|nr:sn-glycerol-3-phosphate ABC transporter ATP-binding protein UgpC [Testudinibacter sp. TR-2022]TNH03919.1 sn-glycerol-3-phosphate ABC transporter ATP-binding protein UgpC [Pasteurellaceae bacterium Phil11]TNH19603.1 sn-glycerol-3-phosphate ABC transporter ATP-binding protein UgpC [Testudinibacter sp. TR-2022]TNH25567.1 sn-glycerol-3-phosphate ABC transporter ATP-binding protein UgpC [Testudinibacter sp. TR-2022]
MSALEIRNVSKIYPNGKVATQHADISIETGEFVVFVGPSGCGKSTLLRMIAGLESVTSGDILLADERINDLEPADRNIAMVFQNYALYPHMTVFNNLAYGLINRKYPKAEIQKRVEATAKMLQLSEYLHSKPKELSGGQRQRVAMGRAIVREPKLFLFDEPLSNLDAKLRNTMRLEIKALQRRLKTTAVYVTHDQVEAMTMADKIVILNRGKVEQIGTPQAIYHRPANLFVATFMGSPAMNILEASVQQNMLRLPSGHYFKPAFALPENWQGRAVKIGIRSEKIQLSRQPPMVENPFLLAVKVVEDLGAQRVIHGSLGSQPLLAVTEMRDITTDETLYFSVASSDIYLFDAESGQAIYHDNINP